MSNIKEICCYQEIGGDICCNVSARPVLQIISLLGLIPWEFFSGIPTRQFLSLRLWKTLLFREFH